MLILLTLFLVLVGTVSLIIGFIQNSLVPIYASIGCSVAAALVLVLYSRIANRPAPGVRLSGGGGANEEADEEVVEQPERTETIPAARQEIAGPAAAAAAQTTVAPEPPVVPATAENPIPDYRSLKVGEIVPLLSGLSVEQLHAVRRAEEEGKSRSTVLNRIDQLLKAGPGQAQRPSRPAKKAASSSRTAKTSGASGAKRAAKKTPARPQSAAAQEQAGTPAAPVEESQAPTGPAGGPEPGVAVERPRDDQGLGGMVWDPTADPSAGNGSPSPQVPSPQSESGTP